MSKKSEELIRAFIWDVAATNNHMEDIRQNWASLLGVSGPQWLILMAVNDLDKGEGVSVGEVSSKLQVNQPFVTTQTKALESAGFLKRAASAFDGRVVLMFLTEKARKDINKLAARRTALNEIIFSDLTDRALRDLVNHLALIRNRAEKAALQLKIDR